MNDDFWDEVPEMATGAEGSGSALQALVKEALKNDDRVEALELEIKALKERRREIEGKELPDRLREMGTETWVDPTTGVKVQLGQQYEYLPVLKDKEEEAAQRAEIFRKLEPVGINDILRMEMALNFPPKSKQARVLRRLFGLDAPLLDADEPSTPQFSNADTAMIEDFIAHFELQNLPAVEKAGAHPMTFKKWFRETVEAGHGEACLEAGLYYFTAAKVVQPRAPRKKKAAPGGDEE